MAQGKLKTYEMSEMQSVKEYIFKLTDVVRHYRKAPSIIAIDITPGLKIMTIAAMSVAIKENVKKIYYTLLKDRTFEEKFVLEIPYHMSELYLIKKNSEIVLLKSTCEKHTFQI